MNKLKNEIQSISDRMRENGGPFWSREDGDIHAPAGFSTIDVLRVLGELGATIQKYSLLRDSVEFILTYQNPDGSFKYSAKSTKLPCMAGRIVAALGRVGALKDARLNVTYHWFLENQSNDGGWRCATVKLGKSPITDASNPGTTLYILDAFRFRDNSPDDILCLNRGIEFLLRHWETRAPLGPCEFGIGSRFLKLNILSLVIIYFIMCMFSRIIVWHTEITVFVKH